LTEELASLGVSAVSLPEDVVILGHEHHQVLKALGALRRTDQEILRLTVWEELSQAEIAVRRAADQVGIGPGEGFHELRHHYASLLISSGCSVTVVQRRLGHATAQETLDTYSHLWPDDDQRTTEAVDSQLGPALLLNPGAMAASENV
jgi:integrase